MAGKTNIDWYRERLAVIEEEFGAKWLAKNSERVHGNPVPRLWGQAKVMLDSAEASGNIMATPELVELFDLASDLEIARTLPGYKSAITIQRLKSPEYEKDCYVAHVAALGVRSGYEVQFVPTSTARTPDLSMTLGDTTLQVECKKKDDYVESPLKLSAWAPLEAKLASLHDRIACDYEVIVCAIAGVPDHSIDEITTFAAQVVTAGQDGMYSGAVPDCVLIVKRNPPNPVGVQGLVLPAWQNPGSVRAKMTIEADGKPTYGPMLRTALYIIDSHRLSQVLSSFNDARTQITPSSAAGMIFIDVDTSRIRFGDHELYFQTLAQSVERLFNPRVNTRIAAVVVTGGIANVETTADHGWHRTSRHWRVICNPFFPESAKILIPGVLPTASSS